MTQIADIWLYINNICLKRFAEELSLKKAHQLQPILQSNKSMMAHFLKYKISIQYYRLLVTIIFMLQ